MVKKVAAPRDKGLDMYIGDVWKDDGSAVVDAIIMGFRNGIHEPEHLQIGNIAKHGSEVVHRKPRNVGNI